MGSPASLWLVGAVRRKLAALFKEEKKEPRGGALYFGGVGGRDPYRVAGGGWGQKEEQKPHRLMLKCS